MTISIIAAIANNNVIGKFNKIPWHLPIDLKYFRKTTLNHHVIMGRKTFESLGNRPLPNRQNIIVTRNLNFRPIKGCVIVNSINEGIKIAKKNNENELFIIGGMEIYKIALPLSHKLYITEIHHNFDGDTFFPQFDMSKWQLTQSTYFEHNEKNQYSCTFKIYECKKM